MMETGKDKGSLKGSRTNVAESNLPLLENPNLGDGREGTPEKERIDIESTIEKEDQGREKGPETESPEIQERRRLRALNCMDQFTIHMNLLNRDAFHINDHINVAFEDVLAEPTSNQGFDQTWGLAYMLFNGTKFWVYRVLAAACAVPCGLLWGLLFSLLSIISVWIVTPAMKIVDVCLHVVRRVWTGIVHAVLDPVFQSASLIRGETNANKSPSTKEVP